MRIFQEPSAYDLVISEIEEVDKRIKDLIEYGLAPQLTDSRTKRVFYIEEQIKSEREHRAQLEEELQDLAERFLLELE